jgi:hypothetical protein
LSVGELIIYLCKLKIKTMRILETKIYTIDEHPNKELCFNYIRDNWHHLNEHSVNEVSQSIKALSEVIGGSYNYSIGQFEDRGEFISFLDYDKEELMKLNAIECPLTGVTWDIDLIEGMQKDDNNKVLNALHNHSRYVYSNEGLLELCFANDYEFNEQGKAISEVEYL